MKPCWPTAKVSGCTVHFADNEFDHGPVIVQRTAPVLDGDTPESLAARVFDQECLAYPEAVRLFAEGLEGRRAAGEASPGMSRRIFDFARGADEIGGRVVTSSGLVH